MNIYYKKQVITMKTMILHSVFYEILVVILCNKYTFAQFVFPGTDLEGMKQLLNDTLSGYDTRIRPRLDQSQTVKVDTLFVPLCIIEFDTSAQTLSLLGYFKVSWQDEVIRWNPEKYSDINTIKVPVSEIWKPRLTISKAFDGDGLLGDQDADISLISSDGEVLWIPEGIYSVVCIVDIQYYPFDEQVCTITYYASGVTSETFELDHAADVSLNEYSENSAWKITHISKNRYPGQGLSSDYINIEFSLQRRANFAIFTLIMPLLMLAFLNICIFLVPIASGEKGSFAITIFLSYGIFVTIVSDTLPDNSLQFSVFLLFIIALLFVSVLSVFYTIIQAKLLSSVGHKECSFKCLRPKSKIENNKVAPVNVGEDEIAGGSGNEKSSDACVNDLISKDEPYTWAMFLDKLDTVAFFVLGGLIVLSTAGFFILMLERMNSASNN